MCIRRDPLYHSHHFLLVRPPMYILHIIGMGGLGPWQHQTSLSESNPPTYHTYIITPEGDTLCIFPIVIFAYHTHVIPSGSKLRVSVITMYSSRGCKLNYVCTCIVHTVSYIRYIGDMIYLLLTRIVQGRFCIPRISNAINFIRDRYSETC